MEDWNDGIEEGMRDETELFIQSPNILYYPSRIKKSLLFSEGLEF